MNACEHIFEIPNVGICCNAYSKTKCKGKINAHYPLCSDENCPLKRPELLIKEINK